MTVEKPNDNVKADVPFSLTPEHIQELLTQHTKRDWKNDNDGKGEYLDLVIDHHGFAASIMAAMRGVMISSPLAGAQLPPLPDPWIIDGGNSVHPIRHHYAEDQMISMRTQSFQAGFEAGKAHEVQSGYRENPVLWFEADQSAADADPRNVIGVDKMLYSTRIHSEAPTVSNPVWPLFLATARRQDMSLPRDLAEANDWINYLRKRTDFLIGVVNKPSDKSGAPEDKLGASGNSFSIRHE